MKELWDEDRLSSCPASFMVCRGVDFLLLLLGRCMLSLYSHNDKMQRLLKTNNLFKPNQVSNLLIRFSLQNFQLIFSAVENDSKNEDFLSSRIGVFKNHSKNALKTNLKFGVIENNSKKKPMKLVLNFSRNYFKYGLFEFLDLTKKHQNLKSL